MKRFFIRKLIAGTLVGALGLGITLSFPVLAAGPTKVDLLTAKNFAILAGTNVTNVPTSVITGDLGLSPAAGSNYSGITTAQVTGTIYAVDGSGPGGSVNNPGLLTIAKNDLTAAYIDAAGRTPTTTFAAGDNQLGGKTLTVGVYRFGHATTANLTAASPLILDAQGDPNAVFIFQATYDPITATSSVVQLINGAQACNVFWQVTSSATLGSSSTFKGTIMSLTSTTANSSANIEGRLLERNAAITLNANTITVPTTCIVAATAGGGAGSSTPGLPNTGATPATINWWLATIPAASILVITAYFLRKKRTI